MDAHWVASSTGLPRNGQPVQFVLDDREVAMEGIYDRRSFRSRWTGYEVDRVRSWRSFESASAFQDRAREGFELCCIEQGHASDA